MECGVFISRKIYEVIPSLTTLAHVCFKDKTGIKKKKKRNRMVNYSRKKFRE